MTRISSLLAPLFAVILGGCMQLVPPRITDLQWTDLEAGEAPPLPGSADNAPPRPILFVHLRTRWDFAALWHRRTMTALARIWFCDSGRPYIAELGGSLVRGEDTLPLETRPPTRDQPGGPEQHHYKVRLIARSYLQVTRPDGRHGDGPAYDLRQSNEDLCLIIVGGAMLAAHYRSNTIRIPAAAIRAALDHTGQ